MGAAAKANDVALEMLRYRREGARRLPPLAADGVSDPLDRCADLPARLVEYTGYDVADLGLACADHENCGHRPAAVA